MIYVVKPGDTLYSLSRQFGVSVLDIARLNQIPDPNILVEGQALLILTDPKVYNEAKSYCGVVHVPTVQPFLVVADLRGLPASFTDISPA